MPTGKKINQVDYSAVLNLPFIPQVPADIGAASTSDIITSYIDLNNKPKSRSYHAIFAEEAADLNSGSYEWSYGAGNPTGVNGGIPIVKSCFLWGLGLSLESVAYCSVGAYKNGSYVSRLVSTRVNSVNKRNNVYNFESSPVQYDAGDLFNFRTVTGSSSSNGGNAVAYFYMDVQL
jgi:hypothetical protein